MRPAPGPRCWPRGLPRGILSFGMPSTHQALLVTTMNHLGRITRRAALQVGGLGMLGLTVPKLLQAAERKHDLPARAKSVIFLYQFGGPSHLDTFDMKPEAPEGIRSPFGSIATTMPGLRICERLP